MNLSSPQHGVASETSKGQDVSENLGSSLRRVLWPGAMSCVAALIALSWVPGQYVFRTGVLSSYQEHFVAYALSGMAVAAASRKACPIYVAAFFILLAGVLELGQNFVPGRSAAIESVFASASGAIAGVALTWLAALLVNRKASASPFAVKLKSLFRVHSRHA